MYGPRCPLAAGFPSRSSAVTARVRSKTAGHFGDPAGPSLPAAATTSTLRAVASAIAVVTRTSSLSDPSDRLMIRAPDATAAVMAAARSRVVPVPSAPRIRSGRILAPGATPATPMPFPATAAMVPATCVPCPIDPTSAPSGMPEPARRSVPGRRLASRSGCGPLPLSITATTTPVPVEDAQAVGALMVQSPHWSGSSGSSAAAAVPAARNAARSEAARAAATRRRTVRFRRRGTRRRRGRPLPWSPGTSPT